MPKVSLRDFLAPGTLIAPVANDMDIAAAAPGTASSSASGECAITAARNDEATGGGLHGRAHGVVSIGGDVHMHRHSRIGARSRHYPPNLRCHVRDVDRIVAFHVRDTHAASEVEFGDVDSLFLVQSLGERDYPTRGHLEPGRVENLGADVRVQTHERKARQLRDSANGLFRSARFRRQTELLVFVRGGNEFVRVRFDAVLEPQMFLGGSMLTVAAAWRLRSLS